MSACTLQECFPICLTGVFALLWSAYQEWRLQKLKPCPSITTPQ